MDIEEHVAEINSAFDEEAIRQNYKLHFQLETKAERNDKFSLLENRNVNTAHRSSKYALYANVLNSMESSPKISNDFIRIEGILKRKTKGGTECEVAYHWLRDGVNDDIHTFLVRITPRRVALIDDQFEESVERSEIKIHDLKKFRNACKIYAMAKIKDDQENKAFISHLFGWRKTGKDYSYMEIPRFLPCDDDSPEAAFQAVLPMLTLLRDYPPLVVLLGYLFLSLSNEILAEEYKVGRHLTPFCLNLYGEQGVTPTEIANLFLNMTSVDPQHPHRIQQDSNIHADYIKSFELENKNLSRDVIFLVYNKERHFHKNSAIVKYHLNRLGEIGYYPVFISRKEIKASKMITVDVSSLRGIYHSEDEYETLRNSVSMIARQFIRDIRSDDRQAPLIRRFRKEIIDNKFADDEAEEYARLGDSLYLFLHTKSVTDNCSKEFLQDLEGRILQILLDLSSCRQVPVNSEEVSFPSYIKAIFVDKTHVPAFRHWEATERNGEREECYYLEYDGYYRDFCGWSKTHVPQNQLNRSFKDNGWVRCRTNGASIGSQRVFGGESLYTLVVFKDTIQKA